jgi:hypothetical protein
LDANLTAGAASGGDVNLYFYAADNQVNYLFNARSYASNRPELTLTVAAVPEPSAWAMSGFGLLAVVALRRWKNQE